MYHAGISIHTCNAKRLLITPDIIKDFCTCGYYHEPGFSREFYSVGFMLATQLYIHRHET